MTKYLFMTAGIFVLTPMVLGQTYSLQEGRAVPLGDTPIQFSVQPTQAIPTLPNPPQTETPMPGVTPMPMPGQNPMPGQSPMPGSATIVRPTTPRKPADPAQFQVRPDESGKLKVNFVGQPWPEVVEWLAEIGGYSLDWQELPGDFLNLRTQREYTVDELRDLINRHLLDRGFTLLLKGEMLTVANIKKLDPSLVPRIVPEDLESRMPHEFVKVSFPLRSMTAEKAVEELTPMRSPNGKLTALKATNRIEAMDAVINLREIWEVMSVEQSPRGREKLVKEYRLKHVKASEASELIKPLLGDPLVPANPSQPVDPNQAAQMAMIAAQQAQAGQQPQIPGMKPAWSIVTNKRENSLLVHAPADIVAVIDEAILVIDVPQERTGTLINQERVQVYRLRALNPEPLVNTLKELGELGPTARIEIDRKSRSIILTGSLADHVLVKTLIERLDGSDRRFEVISLRRHNAEYVAGSIEFMMGGDKKKEDNQMPQYMSYVYGYGSYGAPEEEDKSLQFRVEADVDNNRLLLWANDSEMSEIENLLMKLGEIPPRGSVGERVRVIDNLSPEEAQELLKRLKINWPSYGPNPLDFEEASVEEEEMSVPESIEETAPSNITPGESENEPVAIEGITFQKNEQPASTSEESISSEEEAEIEALINELEGILKEDEIPASESEPVVEEKPIPQRRLDSVRVRPNPKPANSPIKVRMAPNGKIQIESEDVKALDLLEQLAQELTPPRKDYHVFKLKYNSTWAYGVAINLKDFFEDEEKKKNDSGFGYNRYYDIFTPTSNEDGGKRLSKKRPLKFISDSDSNTILVQGADAEQLKTIQELIDIYDRPEENESAAVRKTKLIKIKYSNASVIANAIKEVFRDLLSANDPALQNQNQNQQNGKGETQRSQPSYTYIYGGEGEDGDKKQPEAPVKFKGLLSIGVDEISNTLIVSASGTLLDNVTKVIEQLDLAAKPNSASMQVVHLDGTMNPQEVREAIARLLVKPQQPGQPGQQPIQQPLQPGQQPGTNFVPGQTNAVQGTSLAE